MLPFRVLVIGGYGFFGRRLVERLSLRPGLHITAAGRSASQGQALVGSLHHSALSELSSTTLDVTAQDFPARLSALAPHVVVHASGPFQGQQYQVAKACIAAGAHYIDLADARKFVTGISTLDAEATAAGLAVISGASSVPALSSAVADHLAREFSRVQGIDIGISPGNRTERGLSTVQAILSYCGKPLPTGASDARVGEGGGDRDRGVGAEPRSFGWSGSRRHQYPAPVGSRLLSPCDVPDLVLLPERYLGRPTLSFGAGLELEVLHRGMNVMAGMTRMGLVSDWSRYALLLKHAADWFKGIGSDAGAMHVTLTGELAAQAGQATRTWHLVATGGDGPYVPTLAASALVRKLQSGDMPVVGARPCVGVLTLADFVRESEGLRIEMTESST